MIKRFLGRTVTDLGELEGDYRVFHLQDDRTQSLFALSIAILSLLGLLAVDVMLYRDRRDLFPALLACRGIGILATALFMVAIHQTKKVKTFDRLVLGWLVFAVLAVLFFNVLSPATYLTTAFDIIIPFAIYMLSPLKISRNFALALAFSVGTLSINHVFETGFDPVALSIAGVAQVVVHLLGAGTALQLQTYRRKSFKAYVQERDAKEMVAYLANIDSLTKSLTRRQFFNIAQSEFLRYKRYRRPLSVLVLDADHFKTINDTYGHHAGDVVLKSKSLVVLEQKRAQDTFGRLGGEEFGLILPETNLMQAKVVAERIQKAWESTPSNMDGKPIYSTVSIGVAEASPEDETFDDLLRRADQMLYKAKERGKNQVAAE